MPALLADAKQRREPGVLRPGSPVRYYLTAPLTFAATAATVVESWRSGRRREAITAGIGTASAGALTIYLVRRVNLRLLHDQEPLTDAECRELRTRWHRGNLARMAALGIAMWALRRPDHRKVQEPQETGPVARSEEVGPRCLPIR